MYSGCTVRERELRVEFDEIFQVPAEEGGRGEEEKARAGNGRGLCTRRAEGRQKAVRGGALLVQGQARRRRRAAPVLEDERREIVCAPEDCMGQWNRARLKYGAGKVGVNRVMAGGQGTYARDSESASRRRGMKQSKQADKLEMMLARGRGRRGRMSRDEKESDERERRVEAIEEVRRENNWSLWVCSTASLQVP